MSHFLLATLGVRFTYPDGTVALDGLSVGFGSAQKTAVLGCNGAGKSTLFFLLNGIYRPSRGDVLYVGRPVEYTSRGLRELRRRVGVLFQDPDSQLFSASLKQDVAFGPLNLGLPEAEVRARVAEALRAVGMQGLEERPVHALSYGQRKRACIAGVLAMRPEVLALDEPTAGLDPAGSAEIMAVLDRLLAEGTTLIMATHDLELAYRWADRVIVLHQGRLTAEGPPEEVLLDHGILRDLGSEPPCRVAVYQWLVERGVVRAGANPPRSRAELFELL